MLRTEEGIQLGQKDYSGTSGLHRLGGFVKSRFRFAADPDLILQY